MCINFKMAIASIDILKFLRKISFFLKFHFRLPSHKNHYHNCIWYSYHSDICLDYPKIISEKWNLALNFNCQEAKIITLLFAVMSVSGPYIGPLYFVGVA